ncbi:hypothetical protein CHARACLAT_011804 [Characodon lateralis]|uniref:Uncharacterized protein n=1 Tax=Characodon lateralis TaxID=208331 RepID=A0ABU7E1C1_9TELE|nr:hypothetical protein [Characodon lateralis]
MAGVTLDWRSLGDEQTKQVYLFVLLKYQNIQIELKERFPWSGAEPKLKLLLYKEVFRFHGFKTDYLFQQSLPKFSKSSLRFFGFNVEKHVLFYCIIKKT